MYVSQVFEGNLNKTALILTFYSQSSPRMFSLRYTKGIGKGCVALVSVFQYILTVVTRPTLFGYVIAVTGRLPTVTEMSSLRVTLVTTQSFEYAMNSWCMHAAHKRINLPVSILW